MKIKINDAQLIQKILSGDKTALRKLIDKHYSFTFKVCLKMLYSHQDAEDVNQGQISALNHQNPDGVTFILACLAKSINTFFDSRLSFILLHSIYLKMKNSARSIPINKNKSVLSYTLKGSNYFNKQNI